MQIDVVTEPMTNGRYSIQIQFKHLTYININCESKNVIIEPTYVTTNILEFIYPSYDNISRIFGDIQLSNNKTTCSLNYQCKWINDAIDKIKYAKSTSMIHNIYIDINKDKDLMILYKNHNEDSSSIKIPLSYKNDKDKVIEALHNVKKAMLQIDYIFEDIICYGYELLRKLKCDIGYKYQLLKLDVVYVSYLKEWYNSDKETYECGRFKYIKRLDEGVVDIYFNDVLFSVKKEVFEKMR